MSAATQARFRRTTANARSCRPGLERLEDRWVPSAVRQFPGYDGAMLARGDDNSSAVAIPLGFQLAFLGHNYDHLFINNNGNVTFDQPLSGYNPSPLDESDRAMIAPFFSDVDTRNTASGRVLYGQGEIDGRLAFAVTWDGVGYYNEQVDRTNKFQIVLINRPDRGSGAFDVELNYDRLDWTTTVSSADPPRAGFADGDPTNTFELPGSGSNPANLVRQSQNNAVQGRHLYKLLNGVLLQNEAPVLAPIGPRSIREGESLQFVVSAQEFDLGQTMTYSLLSGPAGAAIDPVTGVLTWAPDSTQGPGDYDFKVGVTDSGNPAGTDSELFTVSVMNVVPTVMLDVPTTSPHLAGVEFSLAGKFDDPGHGSFTATVNYGDGTGVQPLALGADRSFVLRHVYEVEGDHTIIVSVTDPSYGVGTDTFTVSIVNFAPTVTLAKPDVPHHPSDTEFSLPGRFVDAGPGPYTATVDYGDESGAQPLDLAADGSFLLRHTYEIQGNHTILVSVTDSSGAVGSIQLNLVVLPSGSAGLVESFKTVTIGAGENVTTEVVSDALDAKVNVQFARADGSKSDATLFVAVYTAPPLETARKGAFFDIQVKNALPDDQITLTFHSGLVKGGFEFGCFNPTTGAWINLLRSPDLCEVTVDQITGTMTVRFLRTDFLTGTVFTVSLPIASGTTTTTSAIQPATAQAGTISTGTTTDTGVSGGLARTVTFNSNAQLSIALTASRDTQLSVRSTYQGSQGTEASANPLGIGAKPASALNTSVSGGNGKDEQPDDRRPLADDPSFWRWLRSDEGMLELLLLGIDPTAVLPVVATEAPAHPQIPQPMPEAAAEDVLDSTEPAENLGDDSLPGEESDGSDFTFAFLALAPALLASERSKRTRSRRII